MTGELTWRRLGVLVRHLPPRSATVAAITGATAWDVTDHLLATVIDLLSIANWQRGGRKAGPKPTPIDRPGHQRRRSSLTPDQKVARLLDQQRREEERRGHRH